MVATMERTMMTAPEVATVLRLDADTVRTMLRDGKIRAARVGKQWLVATADLDAYLERVSSPEMMETLKQRRMARALG